MPEITAPPIIPIEGPFVLTHNNHYMNFLNGKKTYLVALVMLVYAVLSWTLGGMPTAEAAQRALEALGLATLRAGIR